MQTRSKEIADIYVGDPKHYFYGVAKKVYMEYLEEENTIPSEQEFVALVLVGGRIRAASLSRDGYRFLDDTLSLHNLIYVASAQTLTHYTKPLQMGKWWAQASNMNMMDGALIGANQACR